MALMFGEGFLEDLGAARFLALELLHSRRDILHGAGLLGFLMADDRLQLGVDLQGGVTAGAFDFDEGLPGLRHRGILPQEEGSGMRPRPAGPGQPDTAIIGFMKSAWIAAALACFLSLAGCHKDINTTEAVERGMTNYLAKKSGLSAMDVSVVSVAFHGNEADATVHFQAKGSGNINSGIDMKYILERQGNEWVVKGRSGMGSGANPHGNMGGTGTNPHGGSMPQLPPGHPAIPQSEPAPSK